MSETTRVPFAQPDIGDQEIAAVTDAMRAVLKAAPEKVAKRLDQMQASNKRARDARKTKPER